MLILTGFEPFLNFKKNPSWEIAKRIEGKEIKAFRIPVAYNEVKKISGEILEKYRPDAVISLGLADGRAQISIEMVAVNIMDSKKPDNKGFTPRRMRIFEDGKDAYFSTLPVFDIVDEWHKNGIPGYVSYHAGTYVCNALFYSFLYHREKMNIDIPVGFIHLPSSEDMVIGRENRAYVEMKAMEKAVKIAIEVTSRRLSSL